MNKHEAEKLNKSLSKSLIQKIQKDGEFMMKAFIISGDRTRIVEGFDPNSSEQKGVAAELARYLAKKYHADCIAICAESFYTSIESANKSEVDDLERYRQKHGTMEGHPLCKEAVFVSLEHKDGVDFQIHPFTRNDKGEVMSMGEPVVMNEGSAIDGTLVNLMSASKNLNVPDEHLEAMERELPVNVIPTSALGIYLAPAASNTPS